MGLHVDLGFIVCPGCFATGSMFLQHLNGGDDHTARIFLAVFVGTGIVVNKQAADIASITVCPFCQIFVGSSHGVGDATAECGLVLNGGHVGAKIDAGWQLLGLEAIAGVFLRFGRFFAISGLKSTKLDFLTSCAIGQGRDFMTCHGVVRLEFQ